MIRRVLPLAGAEHSYDVLIGAVGYESRSSHIASTVRARQRLYFPYSRQSSAAFMRNLSVLESLKNTTLVKADNLENFATAVDRTLSDIADKSTVGIDISSLDRRRLAILLASLQRRAQELNTLRADLLYAPAAFSPPDPDLSSSPLEAGPVGPAFHGLLRRTSLPLTAIFGLGYEPQRAIGAFELLEPSRAWAFWPDSNDPKYSSALTDANRLLLSVFEPRDVIRYPVLDPGETYYRLESLVSGVSDASRIVLVPMGPKIFAACCILLGLDETDNRPAVWRIGVSGRSSPVDAHARGDVVGLTVQYFATKALASSS